MHPKKILAIKIRALGDTVLFTAPLMELKHTFPAAEIHALVDEKWAPVLESLPAINHILVFKKPLGKAGRAKALAALALRLRQQNYDCVIAFHASPTTAFLSRATGAKIRSNHFHGHYDKDLFSTVKIPGKGEIKPAIERDMDCIRALGVKVPAGCYPVLFLKPEEIESAKLFLEKSGIKAPILGLGLGASRLAKSWPLEKFAELSDLWCKQTGGSVLAVAGPDEAKLTQHFWLACSELVQKSILPHIHVEHGLSVRELAAVISRLAVFVGNDSGPRHLAVAVNTPSLTLFGPESPVEWHPYRADMHPKIFIEELSCRKNALPGMPQWCGDDICHLPFENHQCMKKIEVLNVLAECHRMARKSN